MMTSDTMPETGLFWHVHHDKLAEHCYSYNERRAYIESDKPKHEVETRLRLFQPVKNPPTELAKAEAALVKAEATYAKAEATYDKAWGTYVRTWGADDRAGAAYVKTRDTYVKARDTLDKVRDTLAKVRDAAMPELVALHAVECPNCPWDGATIFPKEQS